MHAPVQKTRPQIQHILDIRRLKKTFAERVLSRAEALLHSSYETSLIGKTVCWMEDDGDSPSVWTSTSGKIAMQQLGGHYIDLNLGRIDMRGSGLESAVRTVAQMVDIIMVRYPDLRVAARVARVSPVPVINAGTRNGQHPVQGLSDLFTMLRHFGGRLEEKVITIVGDHSRNRASRSIAFGIGNFFPRNKVVFVTAHEDLRPGKDVINRLDACGVEWDITSDLAGCVKESDAVLMMRLQEEGRARHLFELRASYPRFTPNLASLLQPHALVMHSHSWARHPRINEFPEELCTASQAASLAAQVRSSLAVHKAIFKELLGVH